MSISITRSVLAVALIMVLMAGGTVTGRAMELLPPAPLPADALVLMAQHLGSGGSRGPRRGLLTVDPRSVVIARAPASAVGLQLASFWEKDDAKLGWAVLASANPELVDKTPYLVETKTPSGKRYFRLLATGFAVDQEARDLCGLLRARKEDCMVVRN